MSRESISPLKARPLRVPGQSLDRELDKLAWDTVGTYFLLAGIVLLLTLVEWVAYLTAAPRTPWVYSILALALVPFCAYKIVSAIRKARRLRLGRDGERVVGQFLEGLRRTGARVFHDIPGEGFNLDHVVIATSGVVVVETKTRAKPRRGRAIVAFEGRELRVGGHKPDRDPVAQVQAGSTWLAAQLEELTGRRFPVRGAVVFPGWFVEPMQDSWKRDSSLPWVLEPKALPAFIENEPTRMSLDDVALVASQLSRYVRAQEAQVGDAAV